MWTMLWMILGRGRQKDNIDPCEEKSEYLSSSEKYPTEGTALFRYLYHGKIYIYNLRRISLMEVLIRSVPDFWILLRSSDLRLTGEHPLNLHQHRSLAWDLSRNGSTVFEIMGNPGHPSERRPF